MEFSRLYTRWSGALEKNNRSEIMWSRLNRKMKWSAVRPIQELCCTRQYGCECNPQFNPAVMFNCCLNLLLPIFKQFWTKYKNKWFFSARVSFCLEWRSFYRDIFVASAVIIEKATYHAVKLETKAKGFEILYLIVNHKQRPDTSN